MFSAPNDRLPHACSEALRGQGVHGLAVTVVVLLSVTELACGPSAHGSPAHGSSELTPSASAPAASGSGANPQLGSSGSAAAPVAVVNQPPDFELDTLTGQSVRLSDLVGERVILLDFWATYCDPCLVAMPHLQQLYEQHRDAGLVVLGISIDGPESAARVRSTVSKLGVTFPILLDDESVVVAQYNPRTSAPFSVLIARDGSILAQQEGFTTGNAAELDEAITRALGLAPSSGRR